MFRDEYPPWNSTIPRTHTRGRRVEQVRRTSQKSAELSPVQVDAWLRAKHPFHFHFGENRGVNAEYNTHQRTPFIMLGDIELLFSLGNCWKRWPDPFVSFVWKGFVFGTLKLLWCYWISVQFAVIYLLMVCECQGTMLCCLCSTKWSCFLIKIYFPNRRPDIIVVIYHCLLIFEKENDTNSNTQRDKLVACFDFVMNIRYWTNQKGEELTFVNHEGKVIRHKG